MPTEPGSTEASAASSPDRPRPPATLRDYVAIARPDHWIKHSLIVPGIALAYLLRPGASKGQLFAIVFGFLGAAAIASANYVLNEWLDAGYDAFHPTKAERPAASKRMSRTLVWLEYAGLLAFGLTCAALVSNLLLFVMVLFMAGAWIYNIPPIRTKDRAYVDVISEAVNSPLRLTMGWVMIDTSTLPPGSVLLAYWMGGAYLMAMKRFSEQRRASLSDAVESLERYRRSFRRYTDDNLLLSAFVYAQLAAFFLAVFLVKYRIEYLLALPLFTVLFSVYLGLGLRRGSLRQAPDSLFKNPWVLLTVGLLVVAMAVLTFVDIPSLEKLTRPHYIKFP